MERSERRHGGTATIGVTVAIVSAIVVGCGNNPISPSPVPSASPSAPHVVKTASPSPVEPTPSASDGSSRATPRPSADPVTAGKMRAVYEALRPSHLRTITGPSTFDRGADVAFAFELENTGSSNIEVPVTTSSVGTGQWLGVAQTWIEPLAAGVDLTSCMPTAARNGTRWALSGYVMNFGSPGQPFAPGAGATRYAALPGGLTSCFAAGRYRFWLEYRRIDSPTGEVIGAGHVDIVLREPTTWAATLSVGPGRGSASLVLSADLSRATTAIDLRGLVAGTRLELAVHTGRCDPAGAVVVPSTTRVASDRGIASLRTTVTLSAAARRALTKGSGAGLWTTDGIETRCVNLGVPPASTPVGRSPTSFGGEVLREALPGRMAVSASSETVAGRVSQVMDGQLWTTWNAGNFPPAWVELDLGRDTVLTGIRLMPSQLPATANTVHRIYGRAASSKAETLLYEARGETRDEIWMNLTFTRKATVRYVRVVTVSSPSWVAWREIRLVGPTIPAFSAMPEGFHDGALPEVVSAASGECEADGWASDPDDRTADVSVRVLVDGTVVWTGVGDRSIPSLAVGMPGYRVDLTPLMALGVRHEIRVQARDVQTGRWVDLLKTPRHLTCQ